MAAGAGDRQRFLSNWPIQRQRSADQPATETTEGAIHVPGD
jgi:hypothetical protein